MAILKPQNILIIKNRAMGDSIMGLAGVAYLRSLYPESTIYYALPSWITKLYKSVKTDADFVIPFDLKDYKSWPTQWKQLRKLKIDLIYEMHQSGRTGKFFKAYSLINRVPYFFHNHHLKSGGDVLDQGVIKAVIQRDLDGIYSFLGRDKKVPHYLEYSPRMSPLTGEWGQENKIIFGVVATRETKMWPLEYYVQLARLIQEKYPQLKIEIPLSTSDTDKKIEAKLKNLGLSSNAVIVYYPLEELPLKVAEAKLYIGNDTGLKHLAIATGVKTYTLFGPEPPNEWHPYDSSLHPYFYREGLECRTRTAHYCGLTTCDSMICLNEVMPEEVFKTISKNQVFTQT